jgi:hypothetical protein
MFDPGALGTLMIGLETNRQREPLGPGTAAGPRTARRGAVRAPVAAAWRRVVGALVPAGAGHGKPHRADLQSLHSGAHARVLAGTTPIPPHRRRTHAGAARQRQPGGCPGPAVEVAERMGVMHHIREAGTDLDGTRLVNTRGKRVGRVNMRAYGGTHEFDA